MTDVLLTLIVVLLMLQTAMRYGANKYFDECMANFTELIRTMEANQRLNWQVLDAIRRNTDAPADQKLDRGT